MPKYKNLGGNSGISAYETGEDFIEIIFRDGSVYAYTYESAGKNNVLEMKGLAEHGQGLNRFINQNVRTLYDKERFSKSTGRK